MTMGAAVARTVVTTAHGIAFAPLALLCLAASTLCRPLAPGRRLADRVATAVATVFAGQQNLLRNGPRAPRQPRDPGERRRYLYVQCAQAVLLTAVACLVAVGLILAVTLAVGIVRGRIGGWQVLTNSALGAVLLFLAVQGVHGIVAADAVRADSFFGQSERERLQREIDDLNRARGAVIGAVDAERRRIERDLHDGLQQRLVAAGLLVARAARAPGEAEELLAQAGDQIDAARRELREVSWSIYPASLHQVGLEESLLTIAQHSVIPMEVSYDAPRLTPEQEVCLYFTAAELVTNSNKHSAATAIKVSVTRVGHRSRLVVADDGTGGADLGGRGLTGIRSRVVAAGGTFELRSPTGGPTVATAELPCA